MRLPANLILGLTAVLVIVIPVALILSTGGLSEGRYATGVALVGAGLLLVEKGAIDRIGNTHRGLGSVYAAYAVALVLWGIGRFQPENSTANTILFVTGALAVVAGAYLHTKMGKKNL